MRLALMQPYFFPYLGHFALISQVDRWVVFDTAQHIRRGWMNRNRIMKPGSGWQYIIVPIQRCPRDTVSRKVLLDQGGEWKTRLRQQLDIYRRKAPNFDRTMSLLESCLEIDESRLSLLNVHLLTRVCDELGIPFNPIFLSETKADPGLCATPGERVLRIVTAMGAASYLNPIGGAHLLDKEAFHEHGIRLEIQQYKTLVYDTHPLPFEPGLSVIDALMWNPWDKLQEHLLNQSE
jgi:hypothetical protein